MVVHVEGLEAEFERDGVRIDVRLSGEFDHSVVDGFDRALATATRGRKRELVVDVSGLRYVDSAFVDAMLRARRTWGPVALLDPSDDLRRLVEVTEAQHVLVLRSRPR